MEELLEFYYENNAEKLHGVVNGIVKKFGGISNKDMDDFYSLANEVFADIVKKYDDSMSFDAFLYSCLYKRIRTEMTKRNREKRKADRMSVSLDTPVGGEEDLTLRDVIPSRFDMEEEILEQNGESYSERTMRYLDRLSKAQKDILKLKTAGYMPNEIKEKLHISEKQYAEHNAAIYSERNVSLLI